MYLVILLALSAQAQAILNALHANQGIFCSLRPQQQPALTHAQLDIGRTLQIMFVNLVILLALLVQAQVILNAPLAVLGIFSSHHQQLVSTLVQLDMVETLQLKLVYNAIFLVQVVLEQEIINVSLANQGIFCSHHLQYAWALVLQLDTGRTLQIMFV